MIKPGPKLRQLTLDAQPVILAHPGDPGKQPRRRRRCVLGPGEQRRVPGANRIDQGKATVEFPLDQDHQIEIRPGPQYPELLRIA